MLLFLTATTAVAQYLSPVDIAVSDPQANAYIVLADAHELLVVDLEKEEVERRIPLGGEGSGVTYSEEAAIVAVTGGHEDGWCALFDEQGRIVREFAAGFSPVSPVFLEGGRVLAICQRFADEVGFYRTATGQRIATVPVAREPIAAVASADGSFLFVANSVPHQNALDDHVAAAIDVIDTAHFERRTRILLPNGSSGLRDITMDPSGNYGFVTHILGRYQVPTAQLERGWMNTNAVSVIDMDNCSLLATVLLDDTNRGAANPFGVTTVAGENDWLTITHAGTHELSRLPLTPLIQRIESALENRTDAEDGDDYGYDNPYSDPAGLSADLEIMSEIGRLRYPLHDGPGSLAAWRGNALVLEYFSGSLAIVDLSKRPDETDAIRRISLGDQPEMDAVRKGEMRFGDARLCFQQWQSCVSCHPGPARTDALNWDLLNDGIGNPKQTKSMLLAHKTPPAMITGIRDSAEVAVRAGIRFIQFAQVNEEDAQNIDAYLNSLQPKPSPHLIDGELSPLAQRGKEIYNAIGCVNCHSGPYYTDLKTHPMRYSTGMDEGRVFDTPTLVEIWRTAPYLYDGRAATMEEALRIKTSRFEKLSEEDRKALVEYVLSL